MMRFRRYFRFLPSLVLVLFFVIQWYFFKDRTQSFYFEDETEHLTPAWMMLNFGKRLYLDISTNHQPLPIIFAAIFFRLVQFNTLFLLVERIRQVMFLVSFLGAAWLVCRFSWRGLLASLLVEAIKFYLFGYHLLAESLIMYPAMYMVGVVGELVMIKAQKKWFDDFLMGMAGFWLVFNWLPAIPFVVISSLVYLWRTSKTGRVIYVIAGLVPTLLLFFFINPFYWYEETVQNLIKYYLPHEQSFLSLWDYWQFLLYPVRGFLYLPQPLPLYLAGISLMFLLAFIHKTSKEKFILLGLYLMVVSLNLRIVRVNVAFYEAFHLLPLVAGLTMLALVGSNRPRIVRGVLILGLLVFTVLPWWRAKADKFNEHFIQYSDFESAASAIAVMKDKNSTLMTGPMHGYVNIRSGVPLADRQNAHLDWSFRSKKLSYEFMDMMANNPPTFIYFPASENAYYHYLNQILSDRYVRARRSDGNMTSLYVLNERAARLTDAEKQNLNDLYYQF